MVEEAKKWQGSCASGRTGRPSPAFAGEGRRFEAGHRPEGSKRGGEARQDGSGRSGPIRESAGQVAKAGEQRFERRFGGIRRARAIGLWRGQRSEEQTSELQSLMRISYAGFCLKQKKKSMQG